MITPGQKCIHRFAVLSCASFVVICMLILPDVSDSSSFFPFFFFFFFFFFVFFCEQMKL